jgi:hypothetical protein
MSRKYSRWKSSVGVGRLWIGGYFSPTTFDPNIVNVLLREFWDEFDNFEN